MDYRDNPQHRALLQAWLADFYAATVVYFCSGEWCVFTPALTIVALLNNLASTREVSRSKKIYVMGVGLRI
jgi:hypothetical protein